MTASEPLARYHQILDERKSALAKFEARDLRIANVRTVVFALAVLDFVASWTVASWSFWTLVVPALIFVYLMVAHERVIGEKRRLERAILYYERCLRRLGWEWQGDGNLASDWLPDDHLYARDLDLFGKGSLFDLIGTARTRAGLARLAAWLGEPASVQVIRERQEASAELKTRVTLREELALLADGVASEVHPDALCRWGAAPPVFRHPGKLAWLAWTLTGAAGLAALAWPLTAFGPLPLAGVAVLQAILGRWMGPQIENVMASIDHPERELRVLAAVLERIERESVDAPWLKSKLEGLRSADASASDAVARLASRVVWSDAMRNQFFYVFGVLVGWRLHFALAIEAWRQRHGRAVSAWLDVLADFEAISAIAGFAYEHPDFTDPEIVVGSLRYCAEAVGHPLLPAESRVRNDVELGDKARIFVVSGSNMSGKSTLLRTVGINAVLALAGAPVCARRLRLTRLTLGASIRSQDSLLEGRSRFYAEILRLKQIFEVTESSTASLILLDEVLHGTNSHDRTIGAQALLESFLTTPTLGLITTHDLAIAQAADAGRIGICNVHLADELVDGELVFDYTLREGVVQRSNALELMRILGLPV